jgi:hypothetical protein
MIAAMTVEFHFNYTFTIRAAYTTAIRATDYQKRLLPITVDYRLNYCAMLSCVCIVSHLGLCAETNNANYYCKRKIFMRGEESFMKKKIPGSMSQQ